MYHSIGMSDKVAFRIAVFISRSTCVVRDVPATAR